MTRGCCPSSRTSKPRRFGSSTSFGRDDTSSWRRPRSGRTGTSSTFRTARTRTATAASAALECPARWASLGLTAEVIRPGCWPASLRPTVGGRLRSPYPCRPSAPGGALVRLAPVGVVNEPLLEVGYLVVQRAGWGAVQRVPVKAREAMLLGVSRHPLDHCHCDAPPSYFRVHEQVREIASPAGPPDAGVEDVVRDADHPAVQSSGDTACLLPSEHALPGLFVALVVDLGSEVGMVATSQRFPAGAIGCCQGSDLHHGANPALRSGQHNCYHQP